MPLVELAVGSQTSEVTYQSVRDSLVSIGKVPVRCSASSPGYIVPRIQALAMNEAARMVEEGVASAEDIDTAVRVGFGLRFSVLGLLEFIDWGGNDILFHGTSHLSRTLDKQRFQIPDIVKDNMDAGHNGLRDGKGFYEYTGTDTEAYRRMRLGQFLNLIEFSKLLPVGLKRNDD
jgi:3-hydroxybutyryl-CoA dehydrogenase